MTDLSQTIAPKSDQLNADDLIAGPRTITITKVNGNESNADQPINIYFEGDGGKPYRPCKSMRRVLVQVWGKDGHSYTGRSMTLYRDPDVQFGGLKVGGIRISHMTDIDAPVTMALTATRANRKPFTVRPLAQPKAADDPAARWVAAYLAKLKTTSDPAEVQAFVAEKAPKLNELREKRPELAAEIDLALAELPTPEGPDDEQRGEPVTLESAKAEIDAAEFVRDVNSRCAALAEHLDDAAVDELRSHAMARVEALQKGGE